ncbi:Serine/threonine-protein kinase PknD [Maioricimonas rarisocia]|uniref:Serine/threonine-protein kinase PknD n=1 Tax=Maioricimonas rarisocia TaxID=2528026 RepID=A0A517Z4B5_9PLAN|nr:serine/threonine-protein kinase [Maioricimonas rarisocia]QDU37267.1 Serine/threonine-protein kinase PknD [Maioricimonas rarisocia]
MTTDDPLTSVPPQPAADPLSGSGTAYAFVRPLPTRDAAGDGSSSGNVLRAEAVGGDQASVPARLFPDEVPGGSDLSTDSIAGVGIGHFVVEERIGRGGMGAVFRAVDRRLDRVVALKVLSPRHSRDSASVMRFQNEARAAARLDHENIAGVHFIGEDQGLHYIAFEFVHGTNIRDFILQKGRLTPSEAVNYTLQIANALRHTDAAGVIHRDIKPSNIVVTPSGRAKLVDLGLARQQQSSQDQELTVAGTTLGTFDYIAPEQARDPRDVDIRADIYSLGCTLYHMLAGEPPYPRGTLIQKVVDHHHGEPPDPAERNPAVPPMLSRIVRQMMASQPDDRYGTVDALIDDLSAVAHNMGLRPVHPESLIWVEPLSMRSSRGWERNAIWVAMAGVLVAIVWGLNHFDDSPATSVAAAPGGAGAPSAVPAATSEGQLIGLPGDLSASASDEFPVPAPSRPIPDEKPAALAGESGTDAVSSSEAMANAETAAESLPDLPRPVVGSPSSEPRGSLPDLSMIGTLDVRVGSLQPGNGLTETRPASTDEPAPFVVLKHDDGADQAFRTLEAACAAARDGAVIELAFDGPLPEPQEPIRIVNKRLTLRAQENRRPVIRFRGGSGLASDYVTRMITVSGGSVEIYNVDLLAHVADAPAVMFALEQSTNVLMRGVTVTLDNPQQRPASVIELVDGTQGEMSEMMTDRTGPLPIDVHLESSLFRGNGHFVWCRNMLSAEFRLNQVALALRGNFCSIAEMMGRPVVAEREPYIHVSLDHVTGLFQDGLLELDVDEGVRPPVFDVESYNSILATLDPEQAFVTTSGGEEARESFRWYGENNFLAVEGPFWKNRAFGGTAGDVELFDFDAWIDYWGTDDWQVPKSIFAAADRLSSEDLGRFDPTAFLLRNVSENPAIQSANDGTDAGVDWTSNRVPTPVRALRESSKRSGAARR